MFNHGSILPSNRTPLEATLDLAIQNTKPDLSDVARLLNPETCPEPLLPWLAWAMSVDDWDASWSEEAKRNVIASSISVHRMKGTIGSIRRALEAAGFGGAVIIEGRWKTAHDGTLHYDGTVDYGGPGHWSAFEPYDGKLSYDASEDHGEPDHWAEYRVRLPRPITIAQSLTLRRILASIAPARCHLKRLYFTQVAYLFDRSISHDGAYSYGAA